MQTDLLNAPPSDPPACAPTSVRPPGWLSRAEPALAAMVSASSTQIADRLESLSGILRGLNVRTALVVVENGALRAAAARGVLDQALADGGVSAAYFDAFRPNPTCDAGAEAARAAAAVRAQAVVAVGGGSAIDVAKIAALAARQVHAADDLARGRGAEFATPLPLVAVPTTSGTGSECTHFAAVYDGPVSPASAPRKLSVGHKLLRPCAVILDPRFAEAMPAPLAAVTGLDALCQAAESLWAVSATPESSKLARAALRLIAPAIVPSVRSAQPEARLAMMIGSHLCGRAINLSKTTAAHALSYELTQRYGLPHGHAVALTLGHVGAANAAADEASCAHPAGVVHVQRTVKEAADLLGTTPDGLPAMMQRLLASLNLPDTLAAAGVAASDLPELARAVDPVRLANNPRSFSVGDLEALLARAF